MATIRFILKEPYLKSTEEDKEIRKQENELIKLKIQQSKKKHGKNIPANLLNPKETRIYLTLTEKRGCVDKFRTNEKIQPKNWNFEKQRARTIPGSVELNINLDKLKTNVGDLYRKLRNENPDMPFGEICQYLKGFIEKEQYPNITQNTTLKNNFFEVYDRFMESKAPQRAVNTMKKYRSIRKMLMEFQSDTRIELSFESIDMKLYDKLVGYLLTKPNPLKKRTGRLNDTVSKYVSELKNFMQWSLDRGYHTNTQFLNKEFKASRKPKQDIITLTEDEIDKIKDVELSSKPHLDRIRDIFLFAYYTGQRWGDIENFKKEDVNGFEWNFEQIKTEKQMSIPFTGFSAPALVILRKYNNELPIVNQQHFNDEIKKIGKMAGIDENVSIKRYIGKKQIEISGPKYEFMSAHMARRTCVTILLEKGAPPTTVMKLTGHTDLRTMMKYENTSKQALERALNQVVADVPEMKIV